MGEETEGSLELNQDNKYLSANNTVCDKMGGGLQPDGCCGNAPVWRPYNTAQKTCVNGVLRNPALFPTTVIETTTQPTTTTSETEETPTQGQIQEGVMDQVVNAIVQ